MRRKTLYLVDGNSYCYRAYYAIGDLSTADGRPTGAIYGFVSMLNKLRHDARPDYLAVCFDMKKATFRHERYAEYKINRKPMPDDLAEQLDAIKELISAYGIPRFELSGYEADDIIATLAVRLKSKVDVFIVTADKDMLQLVDKYVKIYNPQRKPPIVDIPAVVQRYNVTPERITDLIALAGDNSDNIPGVPGIGPKTAAELIQCFGDVEQILAHTSEITQKKRRSLLEEYADQARLSKELAEVCVDVPLSIDLQKLALADQDTGLLRRRFREFEFRHFLHSLPDDDPAEAVVNSAEAVTTGKELAAVCEILAQGDVLILDISRPQGIAQLNVSNGEGESCALMLDNNLSGSMRKPLQALLQSALLKVGHDLKALIVALQAHGLSIDGPFFDLMIAAYLLEPAGGSRSLSELVSMYAGTAVNHARRGCMERELYHDLAAALDKKQLRELALQIEMPLVRVLAGMEHEGIRVDGKILSSLDTQISRRREELTAAIHQQSGASFNINSPQQLAEVLFGQLKLPVFKKGKTGPSTDAEVLMRLSSQHELPGLVLEYRELAKLQSTYVEGLLQLLRNKRERIHTSFNQAVTATGRLSSSAPNLQNIPIKTETGRQIRAAFTARKLDWLLLSADYSQIELRVLAHLSGDEQLIAAFRADKDIHNHTASLIFGVEADAVDRRMRDVAKRVNFGIVYGMGPFGLARDLGVAVQEAKTFINEYFQRYPGVDAYMQRQIQDARRSGYVTTLLHRRRYLPQIKSKDQRQRAMAERMVMNTPIQGTAADLIKAAMIAVDELLRRHELKGRMVLQVHDELVFDVPKTEAATVAKLVKTGMEDVLRLDVPIKVTIKTGSNWKEMGELTEGEQL